MPAIFPELEESAAEFEQKIGEKLRSASLRIFLCGASVNRAVRPKRAKVKARLRYEIMQKLTQEGCEVILGEDKEFYRAARSALKENLNHADNEILIAAEHADLTIILPCSAGSFAELGMFALINKVPLVIVIDDREEYRNGYIAKGPALMAEKRGSIVEFASYGDIDQVWNIIKTVIDEKRSEKMMHEIICQR